MELDLGDWKIRSWAADDASSLAKYANNRDVWINVRDSFPHPYSLEHARTWIGLVREAVLELSFAIASPQEIVGSIGLTLMGDVHRRSAEIGYWIAKPYWGRGIATVAVRALTAYAFDTYDLVRIFGEVFEGNHASGRVLEKAGYIFEGRMIKSITKDGRTIDSSIYAITR